jgi:hypothetical protein
MSAIYGLLLEAALQQAVEACVTEVGRRAMHRLLPATAGQERRRGGHLRLVAPAESRLRIEVRSDTPGRIRLAVPAVRQDPAGLGAILQALRRLPGVLEATGSVTTGTVLVCYDPGRVGAAGIERAIRRAAGSRPGRAVDLRPAAPQAG